MTLARTRINFLAVGVFALVLVGTQKSPASAATPPATPPDVPQAKPSPLLAVMKGELDRSFKTLSTQDPAAYYIGYTITDHATRRGFRLQRRAAFQRREPQSLAGSWGPHRQLRSRYTHRLVNVSPRMAGREQPCRSTMIRKSCAAKSGWKRTSSKIRRRMADQDQNRPRG